jgi:alkanesulfonate monooxygenase SsuD/methylene tetrahydromethanopterin reductase-like flavin-dependent oxidoreductase (luciferase family)
VTIYNGIGRSLDPFLEGYTSMGFLAGLTQDMTLTMLVTGVTYRYPGVLAKTVTTLDVLSGGRSMFGIGAAWYEREHLALGVPYPPICNQMWSDATGRTRASTIGWTSGRPPGTSTTRSPTSTTTCAPLTASPHSASI